MTRTKRGEICNHEKQLAIAERYADTLPQRFKRSELVEAFLHCYLHGERNTRLRANERRRRVKARAA